MVIVLPGQVKRSKWGSVGAGLGLGLGEGLEEASRKREADKIRSQEDVAASQLGVDLSRIHDPEMRKELLKDALLGRRETSERQFQLEKEGRQKYEEGVKDYLKHQHELELERLRQGGKRGSEDREQKYQQYQNALDTVNRMKELRKKGNLGVFSKHLGTFSPKTRQHRGEYETLGNSLIQLASNIPIRNKEEFNKLSGHLSDPDVTDAEAKGILDGLEKIIKDSMSVYESEGEISERRGIGESKRPPLSDFRRR